MTIPGRMFCLAATALAAISCATGPDSTPDDQAAFDGRPVDAVQIVSDSVLGADGLSVPDGRLARDAEPGVDGEPAFDSELVSDGPAVSDAEPARDSAPVDGEPAIDSSSSCQTAYCTCSCGQICRPPGWGCPTTCLNYCG